MNNKCHKEKLAKFKQGLENSRSSNYTPDIETVAICPFPAYFLRVIQPETTILNKLICNINSQMEEIIYVPTHTN